MHPLHEQYVRNPPTNSLQQLFSLLDRVDAGLREEVILRAAEVVESAIDFVDFDDRPIYLTFRLACERLCEKYPEDVVVRHVVNHTLWLLLQYDGPLRRRRLWKESPPTASQLQLFETAPERPAAQFYFNLEPIYQRFCDQILAGLFAGWNDVSYSDEVDLMFLALCEVKGVGYWTLRKVVRSGLLPYLFHLDSPEEFESTLRSAGAKIAPAQLDDSVSWREELLDRARILRDHLHSINVTVVHATHPTFPPILRNIDDPPSWLFVQGNASTLGQPSVAIVGTRTPTADGMKLAEMVGECIPSFNAAIVSGLADGIDQKMHVKSIESNVPTIAVLGTGILSNYPSGSEPLREEICRAGGAVITEYLPRDSYSSKNFVRRNRIQAGLSRVTLPVEWRERSGTAHTVRFAYEAKRRIVCARLAAWKDSMHSELAVARRLGAAIFTLPDERDHLVDAVRNPEEGAYGPT